MSYLPKGLISNKLTKHFNELVSTRVIKLEFSYVDIILPDNVLVNRMNLVLSCDLEGVKLFATFDNIYRLTSENGLYEYKYACDLKFKLRITPDIFDNKLQSRSMTQAVNLLSLVVISDHISNELILSAFVALAEANTQHELPEMLTKKLDDYINQDACITSAND